MRFKEGSRVPTVFADGPKGRKASPHRYDNDSLCMWLPGDERGAVWTWDDGLVALIGIIALHLFREAWWRETGEWPGPEAPHPSEEPKVEKAARDRG